MAALPPGDQSPRQSQDRQTAGWPTQTADTPYLDAVIARDDDAGVELY